ncbi:hypothetical protein BpHYR1_050704 [Brachionus plicatilis]|uniref:Uncharacterized protein n=1 Tax=Brachionus plicatilis TaxID=10195 RepID=A0A3M7QFF3_BRAPC|nr:hypothetical protein BpHYR1_050704 [Brachionus plicatilis]
MTSIFERHIRALNVTFKATKISIGTIHCDASNIIILSFITLYAFQKNSIFKKWVPEPGLFNKHKSYVKSKSTKQK